MDDDTGTGIIAGGSMICLVCRRRAGHSAILIDCVILLKLENVNKENVVFIIQSQSASRRQVDQTPGALCLQFI